MNVYGWNTTTGGVGWYRVKEPLRGLSLRGHTVAHGPQLDDDIVSQYEVVMTHALHDEPNSEAWELLAKHEQHLLVMDVDDDVWAAVDDPEIDPRANMATAWTPERLTRLERNLSIAHVVTTPSEVLAERIAFERGLNSNVYVLPNYVPAWLLDLPRVLDDDGFVVGYQGAPQHQPDLTMIAGEMYRVLMRHADVRFRFYGPGKVKSPGWPPNRIEAHAWNPDVESYYRSLQMHVGIAPLVRNRFNEAKSAIRAVEYAALGIPAVFSDLQPYRGWVLPGETGYLVHDMNLSEWNHHLSKLHNHPFRLRDMSRNARAKAIEWTTEGNAWRWEAAYGGR